MANEQFEMFDKKFDSEKENYIFGSWKRKNRRKFPLMTNGAINIISISSDSESSASKERLQKRNNMKTGNVIEPEAQRGSTYRPASYETSSFCDTDIDGPLQMRDSVNPSSEPETTDENDLWCPRCGGRMTEPRILECLHPICTPCIDELFDQAYSSTYCDNVDQRWESSQRERLNPCNSGEGCPVCDYPLPHPGSPVPPPHYPLQHRLVIDAVHRRLSDRVLCCDICPEEVQASVHCPSCLGNFCRSCGSKHEIMSHQENDNGTTTHHGVRPLWEAKSFRRTALCLKHPTHSLRFHCIACRQVTCRECMWRGSHRGHASEGASGAGKRATASLVGALQRGRSLLNALLIEYNNGSFANNDQFIRSPSTYYTRNNRYSDEFPIPTCRMNFRSRLNPTSYAREARDRIHEFARLQKARYLLDAVSLGEELLAEGSDIEILSLSRIILKRLQMLESNCETENQNDSHKMQSTSHHTGVFHCCTFCSSGGKKESTCACRGTMPGGYRGCGHGHPGHPRANHWSCCGSTDRYGCCLISQKLRYQVIL